MEEKQQVNHSSNEIPGLYLSKKIIIGELEQEVIDIQAKGWTMEEAITGFKYLLNKALKKLEAKK